MSDNSMEGDKSGDTNVHAVVTTDVPNNENGLHLATRGADVGGSDVDDTSIRGFDVDRMHARTLLTAAEEKKVLRKIDLRIMPLCSFMFMLKNLDAQNISNARIMNEGTPQNIMTQLGLSSNQYALLAVLYYVSTTTCVSCALQD